MSSDKRRTEKFNLSDTFASFDADEHADIKELWEASANASPNRPVVSSDEVDKAWKSVTKKIDKGVDRYEHSSNKAPHAEYKRWKWVAAAAVLLLVAGIGFLFTPKTIITPPGKTAKIILPDGSAVELNSGSEIQYNRLFGYTNRAIQMNGEAFFAVKKADHPFIVRANGASVRVTGTKFNVRSWKTETGTELAVAEGSVKFSRQEAPDHPVTVSAGQSSKLDYASPQPSPPKDAAIDRITGWRINSLLFNDKSLTVIFNELERRFDVHITIKDSSIGERTLTAYYSNPGSIASVLQDICRVKGLKFAPTSDGYRVYE